MADKGSGFQSTDLSLLSLIQSRRLRKEIISFSYKTEIFVSSNFYQGCFLFAWKFLRHRRERLFIKMRLEYFACFSIFCFSWFVFKWRLIMARASLLGFIV